MVGGGGGGLFRYIYIGTGIFTIIMVVVFIVGDSSISNSSSKCRLASYCASFSRRMVDSVIGTITTTRAMMLFHQHLFHFGNVWSIACRRPTSTHLLLLLMSNHSRIRGWLLCNLSVERYVSIGSIDRVDIGIDFGCQPYY